jgi:hypothetical protein
MTTAMMLALVLTTSVEDQLEGAEIGDANQYLTFGSGGKYSVEISDKKAGTTKAKGTWTVAGESVEVKYASCAGPACKELGPGYKADIGVVSDRAMTVKSPDRVFSTGSYYCHYQGCEKRIGVLVQGHGARPLSLKYVVDFLIDKNRGVNLTVVWQGKHVDDKAPATTVTWCQRDEARSKPGAEAVAKYLAELGSWLGKVEAKAAGDKECLWDVRVLFGDEAMPPATKR